MQTTKQDLSLISSLHIGSHANVLEIDNTDILKDIKNLSKGKQIHIIGEGTNTYFGNNLSKYFLIKPKFFGIEFLSEKDDIFVRVFASENWDELVTQTVNRGYWGIENLSLIPGSVGAAPVQNIGAYGTELKDVLVECVVFDFVKNEQIVLNNNACKFAYRDSVFKRNPGRYLIISIKLKLSSKPKPVLTYQPLSSLNPATIILQQVRDLVVTTRKQKLPDPKINPNCGSFFKNVITNKTQVMVLKQQYPDLVTFKEGKHIKIPSAYLIDKVANLKGYTTDNFILWPTQALVIVNMGNGKIGELKKLVKFIQKKVFEKTGLTLEQEVNQVG